MTSATGGPPRTRRATWVVEVTFEEPEQARDWDTNSANDLADRFGEDSDEFAEALGPAPGYHPVTVHGPYTERQARALVARLEDPETRARLKIAVVVPMRLHRFLDPDQPATPRRRARGPAPSNPRAVLP